MLLLVGAGLAPAAAQQVPGAGGVAASYERSACPTAHLPPSGFRDVAGGDVHHRAIVCMLLWEVTQGRTADRYDPLGTVTRAQMASFVHRTLVTAGERFAPDPPRVFTDVDGVHAAAIHTLAAVGVVRGVAPGRFDPHRPVTRAESATLLHRTAQRLLGWDLEPQRDPWFVDVSGTHEPAIRALAEKAIVLGVSDRRFGPAQAISRAQMASMIARILGWVRQFEPLQVPWELRFHPAEPILPGEGIALDGSVAVADLTGDGRDDLVYHEAGRSGAGREHRLHVLHAGARGLRPVQSEPTRASGAYPGIESVAIGRFTDGPGPDVAHPTEDGGIEVWRNDGSGRFASVAVLEDLGVWQIVAGDVTGNGLDDLVGRQRLADDVLRLVPQTAPGVFGPAQVVAVPEFDHRANLVVGDLDGDGRVDLAVVGHARAVSLYQRAPGVFETHEHAWPDDAMGYGGTVGDVTGDGADDLVLNRGGLYVHRIAERGPGGPPDTYREAGTVSPGVLVADLTGDGHREVIAPHHHPGFLRVYLVGDDGTVGAHQDVGAPDLLGSSPVQGDFLHVGHQGVAVLDATGNGKADLVAATSQGLRVAPRY